jgi:hypothetical protein
LKSLAASYSNNESQFEKLSTQITKLQSNINLQISQIAPESLNPFIQIQQMSNVVSDYVLQQKTLEALKFGDMYRRYDSVEEAHLKTFEWILSEQVDKADPERQAAKKLFTSWLASGSGIFHISGKLGAGKSTLMKFFCEHDRILELLKEWAGIELSALIFCLNILISSRWKNDCVCKFLLLETRKRVTKVITRLDALLASCNAQSYP